MLFRSLVLAIEQTRSITRGAAQEHLALAAASKRLSDLESRLGVQLFERRARGVEPTEAGRALVRHIRSLHASLYALETEVMEFSRGIKGHLRIASNTSAIAECLPPYLVEFSQAHGQIRISLEDLTSAEVQAAVAEGRVDRLVMPIENSTTGSILPVLDRLLTHDVHITGEHLEEIQHALLAHPGATLESIRTVHSHPQALSQAESTITRHGWDAQPEHDTAGAVRLVAERGDPAEACLAHPDSAEAHGLVVLLRNVVDRPHNTTRFVVLEPGPPDGIPDEADRKSTRLNSSH